MHRRVNSASYYYVELQEIVLSCCARVLCGGLVCVVQALCRRRVGYFVDSCFLRYNMVLTIGFIDELIH